MIQSRCSIQLLLILNFLCFVGIFIATRRIVRTSEPNDTTNMLVSNFSVMRSLALSQTSNSNDSSVIINLTEDISIYQYDAKKPNAKICEAPAFLLLVINSKPNHHDRRMAIRSSWGNGSDYIRRTKHPVAWRTVFVVGKSGKEAVDKKVREEGEEHGDLVFGDFQDNLKSLTDKTVLGMRWAYYFCRPKFYFKGDDDVFINAPRLFELILQLERYFPTKMWICRAHIEEESRYAIRDRRSKYAISRREYSKNIFPQFCSGYAYVLTSDVLEGMLSKVKSTRIIKVLDDVYVGMLADKMGILPKHDRRYAI